MQAGLDSTLRKKSVLLRLRSQLSVGVPLLGFAPRQKSETRLSCPCPILKHGARSFALTRDPRFGGVKPGLCCTDERPGWRWRRV